MVEEDNEMKAFYLAVIQCREQECVNCRALNDVDQDDGGNTYNFPRWFYRDRPKDILFLAMNPGKLDRASENEYISINRTTPDRHEKAKRLFDHQTNLILRRFANANDLFHGPIVHALVRVCGGVPRDEILEHVNFSNVVKCTTRENFNSLDPEYRRSLINTCVEKHLRKEIELLSPKIIILYNDECTLPFLIRPKIEALASGAIILSFTRHRSEIEAGEIEEAKRTLKSLPDLQG